MKKEKNNNNNNKQWLTCPKQLGAERERERGREGERERGREGERERERRLSRVGGEERIMRGERKERDLEWVSLVSQRTGYTTVGKLLVLM